MSHIGKCVKTRGSLSRMQIKSARRKVHRQGNEPALGTLVPSSSAKSDEGWQALIAELERDAYSTRSLFRIRDLFTIITKN